MQIAIVKDNNITKIGNLFDLFPGISFPAAGPSDDFLAEHSIMPLITWEPFDEATQKQDIVSPYIKDGKVYNFKTIMKTENELAQDKEKSKQLLIGRIINGVQNRLDNFAQTKNYDNILSACTYATSKVPEFKKDGQKAVDLRDEQWRALYIILDKINLNDKSIPDNVDEILKLLPDLVW